MKRWIIMGMGLVVVLILGWKMKVSMADEDEYLERTRDVAAVENAVYKEECGSCHMAYPPGLLPGRSWEIMMASLDDHFGENAELDSPTAAELTRFLVDNSADAAPNYRRSRKIMRNLPNESKPLRITELAYFRHEHRQIPERLIAANPEVGSLSNCNACHRNAELGSFSEREINIPRHGKWDD
jgi:hypothetical protein